MNYKVNGNDYFDDLATPRRKKAVKKTVKKGCFGNDGGPHVYFTTRVRYYRPETEHGWDTYYSYCIGCDKKQRVTKDSHVDDTKYFHITGRTQQFTFVGRYVNKDKFNKLMEKN